MPSFAGIDLTCSENKKSTYALLSAHREIMRLCSYYTDGEIIAAIERDRPSLVGCDAPLSLPKDLHCVNEDCPCTDLPTTKGRQCERELAKQGIPCYFTTKKSIIREMVNRALILKKNLSALGYDVIEIYPYASKRRLWGNCIPRKTTAKGRQFLHERLSTIIGNIEEYPKLTHDQYDALIAAHTTYLYHKGETDLVGDRYEGQICVPRRA